MLMPSNNSTHLCLQKELNIATEFLNVMLKKSYCDAVRPPKPPKKGKKTKEKSVPWRVDPELFKSPPNPKFHPGTVDFSAGWFAQAHEVTSFSTTLVHLKLIHEAET